MTGFRAVLAAPPPGRPPQAVPGVRDWLDDQRAEQRGDLVAGGRDLIVCWWVAIVPGGGDDGEEGQGEHGQGGPPVLGVPAADLVFIQSGQSLARLEVFRGLPDPGDLDQCGERDAARAVAPVERQFHGAAVAADQ